MDCLPALYETRTQRLDPQMTRADWQLVFYVFAKAAIAWNDSVTWPPEAVHPMTFRFHQTQLIFAAGKKLLAVLIGCVRALRWSFALEQEIWDLLIDFVCRQHRVRHLNVSKPNQACAELFLALLYFPVLRHLWFPVRVHRSLEWESERMRRKENWRILSQDFIALFVSNSWGTRSGRAHYRIDLKVLFHVCRLLWN